MEEGFHQLTTYDLCLFFLKVQHHNHLFEDEITDKPSAVFKNREETRNTVPLVQHVAWL
jgi:hypothetical protein